MTETVVDDGAPATETAPPAAEPSTPAPSQPAAPARQAPRARRESAPVASRTSPAKRDSHAPSIAPAATTARTQEPRANAPLIPHPANEAPATSATRTPAEESIALYGHRWNSCLRRPRRSRSSRRSRCRRTGHRPALGVLAVQRAARVEERVEARVARDVRADGRVAIPAGSRMIGSVSVVDRGGKMKEQARLGVRFHTVILADGTEVPLQTETIYRVGDSPGSASAAKVGGGAIGGDPRRDPGWRQGSRDWRRCWRCRRHCCGHGGRPTRRDDLRRVAGDRQSPLAGDGERREGMSR